MVPPPEASEAVVRHESFLRTKESPLTDVAGEMRRANALSATKEEEPRDAKALQEEILKLVSEGGGDGYDLNHCIEDLIEEDGAAGLEWCSRNLPGGQVREAVRCLVFEDPDATFDFIVSNPLVQPCSGGALTALLDHKAESGSEALKQALAQVPWGRFAGDSEPGEESVPPELESGRMEHFEAWRDSGMLRSLAEMGINVSPFDQWSRLDAKEALKEWATWPRLSEDEGINGPRDLAELQKILWSDDDGKPVEEHFRDLWSGSSPQERERIVAALGQMTAEDVSGDRAKMLKIINGGGTAK